MASTSTLAKYVDKFDGKNFDKFSDSFGSYMQMMGLADTILRKPRFHSAEEKYTIALARWHKAGEATMTDEARTAHERAVPNEAAFEDDEGYEAWWKMDQQAQGTFKLSIERTFHPAF